MFSGDVAGSSNFVAKLPPTTSNRIHSRVGAVGDFGRRSFGRGSPSSGGRNFGKGSACWQYSDSASAIAIVGGDSASWRTRHLRKRARYMRWRVLSGDVILRHTPGNGMIADLGTKALAALKLEELKKAMGMTDRKIKTEKKRKISVW